jgi:SulP family sulfate permease
MTGRRHRSNCELVAQGVANIGSGLFGGFCVTGTIARTATNVRAGAHGPVSGMLHAIFLALFMAVAAPLASYIPLAALAGVLAVVAWNMIEKHAMAALVRSSRGDAAVLAVTLLLTVFRDLTEAIIVGFALGAILFIDRMGRAVSVETHKPFSTEDVPDELHPEKEDRGADPDTVIYQISGAFFFGAASTVGSVLDRIADQRQNFVLDCSKVAFFDSTAANVIEAAARKASRSGVRFILSGVPGDARKLLETHGVTPPLVEYAATLDEARAALKQDQK